MEKWANYTIVTALSLALAISLGFNSIPEPNYSCGSRQIKSYCFELSAANANSVSTRCYTLPQKAKYTTCSEGWQKIPETMKLPCTSVAVIAYTDIGKFYCDGVGEDAQCKRFDEVFG